MAFYGAGKAVDALRGSLRKNEGGRGSVIYGTDDIAKYEFNMIETPGPLAEMRGDPIKNFYGGKYNVTTLTKDTVFYRAGKAEEPYGRWFTSAPAESVAQVRIDLAVRPQWIEPATGVLEGTSIVNTNYAIKIPAGMTVYSGPVGYQGGIYLGGKNGRQHE